MLAACIPSTSLYCMFLHQDLQQAIQAGKEMAGGCLMKYQRGYKNKQLLAAY